MTGPLRRALRLLLLVCLTPLPAQAKGSICSKHSGDLTGDGCVNVADLNCLVSAVLAEMGGKSYPACMAYDHLTVDLNCDKKLDVVDLVILVNLVWKCWPSGECACPYSAIPNAPVNDPDADNVHKDCDNCDSAFNPCQQDADGNGVGDECDLTQTCAADSDCAAAEKCCADSDGKNYCKALVNGECPIACTSDATCTGGKNCCAGPDGKSYYCMTADQCPCLSDADCASGEKCCETPGVDGKTYAKTCVTPKYNGGWCPCLVVTCSSDTSCGAEEKCCIGGDGCLYCMTATKGACPCWDDAVCKAGEMCCIPAGETIGSCTALVACTGQACDFAGYPDHGCPAPGDECCLLKSGDEVCMPAASCPAE